MKYILQTNIYGERGLVLNQDGRKYYIPFDERNCDYQKYLEWLAEGNAPEQENI